MDACLAAALLLPSLEPIAGASIAINLAYLNLERFRYRTKIRDHARQLCEELVKPGDPVPDHLLKSRLYAQLRRLASLEDYDDRLPAQAPILPSKLQKMPDGKWSAIYCWLFEKHLDRIISFCAAGIAIYCLVIGVAIHANIIHLKWIACLLQGEQITFWFYLVLFSLLFPIICVWLGRRVVLWAIEYATECNSEIGNLAKKDVPAAEIKQVAVE